MKLVMTLLVKDEVDIIEDQLIYHFNQGIDLVLVTDDGSRDGTLEVLRSFAETSHVQLVEQAGTHRQDESAWRTRLARLATTVHGADWVVHADADELWWPLVGTVRDSLRLVPPAYDAVLAPACNFLYVEDDAAPVIAGLRVREVRPVTCRVAHRACPDVVVNNGHGRVARAPESDRVEKFDAFPPLRRTPFSPLRVFHYPVRSAAQREHVISRWGSRATNRDPVRSATDRQRIVGAGVHDGEFVVDDRVADYYARCSDPRTASAAPARDPERPGAGLPDPESEAFDVEAQVAEWLDRADTEIRSARRRERARGDKLLAASERGPLRSLRRVAGR